MLILALETSGFGGSLALLEDDAVLAERILDSQRRHAQTLVPEIEALLNDQGRRVTDCQLLAVSVGPGSFTGLRVGITCAKTMAYVTKIPVTAIPTFDSIAAGCPPDISHVQVIMNAQRQELFVGCYQRSDDGHWTETNPLAIERAADWMAALRPDDVVTGPGLENIAPEVRQRCRVLPPEFWQPQARHVGRLGLRHHRAGQVVSCWDLLPLYVRKSAAEEKWDANQAARSAGAS